MSRFPDFFIVGAPKAGTSALHRWLAAHPDVHMSAVKEPRFFFRPPGSFAGPGVDRFERNWIRDRDEYLGLFRDAHPGQMTGEGSTDYLHDPQAPELLHNARPDARIVILLRNPIDRAYSGHLHLVRDQHETESFETALALEDERVAAGWLPLFGHRRRSHYADAIERYAATFGRDRVLVLVFEEVVRDPALLVPLCRFLGVKERNAALPRANESGIPRSDLLQRTLRSDALRSVGSLLVGRGAGRRIRERLISRNLDRAPRLSQETRAALRGAFSADVARSAALLGRDLDMWSDFAGRDGVR